MALPSAHAATLKNVAGKSSVQLYRDCLRVADHIASKSPKGIALRKMLRSEFKKNAAVDDAKQVEQLKMNAARGLANYLLYESGSKEPKIRARMNKTTSDMIKQCMNNAKRERERKEKAERGEGAELEHFHVKI
ncbi:hypothetical protein Naga_100081g12 [Nannochloropsis gaditana]|uniref:Complex 1 LYR protein domain-containing protein n=1 Tax=Nannochloropsis gaditana TaxID=72520 RepID=W7T1T1_9STRA|nr:hypothetical protein Naga_100081g12 [Nannochloropsis gaditana]